jgi:tetratricopeptide (TPR) repeat protein
MSPRPFCIVVALALGVVTASAQESPAIDPGQHEVSTVDIMARADSLYSAGRLDEARDAYHNVVAVDPESSRATFRLGQLAPEGSDAAIAMYRRYVELEKGDAWGWIALAEALAEAGDARDAIEAYDAAIILAPDERDAVIARARLLMSGERIVEARRALEAWVARHDGDLEAWRLLARAHRADGDTGDEIDALEHVAALDPEDESQERLLALRSRTAPALAPSIGGSTDSDGSSLTRTGLSGDIALGSRSRVGLQLDRTTASGDGAQSVDRGLVYYALRGADDFRLDARAGVALREDARGQITKAIEPIGSLRARWSGDDLGLELRLQRSLQDATVTLIENGIMLEEALVGVEIPGETMRFRVLGSGGAIVDGAKRNWRFRAAGGPQFLVAPGIRVGAQYDGTMYTGRGRGYFAPPLVHTIEATAAAELEELGAFSVAADVGAGIQQILEEKGGAGTIAPALRGWGSVAWNFAPASSLALELEGYNLVGGAAISGGSGGWTYGAATLSLRWAL